MTFTFARPARDVAPGTSWAFPDHRTMADVIAQENLQRRIDAIVRRCATRGLEPRKTGDAK